MSGASLSRHQQSVLRELGIDVWRLRQPSSDAVAGAAAPAAAAAPEPATTAPAVPVPTGAVVSGDWDAVNAAIRGCTRCALSASRTQAVCGVGSRQADWLIVGEAPGADEDRQGEPFVGRAGQLLNEMLRAIGLRREQVFIANVLKCRPPNNRDPQPAEIDCCLPYLRRQIELLQPKVILVVGRIAAQTLLQADKPLGALRGKRHEFEGIPLVATYHPAYLLRSPTQKSKSWADLLLALDVMAGKA